MRSRYPSTELLGTANYEGHELGFHRYGDQGEGGCTIVHRPGATLYGLLFRLNEADMTRMLEVGGAADHYEAREIDVRLQSGEMVRAVTLRVDGDEGPWAPPEPYARLVLDGAAEAGLSADYRARLARIVDETRAEAAVAPSAS
jgi:cation transport regulator ChaC